MKKNFNNQNAIKFSSILFLSLFISAQAIEPFVFKLPELNEKNADRLDDLSFSKEIKISNKVTIVASINYTNKGNGVMSLPGVVVKLIDIHDDGIIFKESEKKINFVDINGDGFLDLIVSGIELNTETGGESLAVEIFIFDGKKYYQFKKNHMPNHERHE